MVLPIESILSKVSAVLKEENRLILTAAPGSGKTTRIPLALLEEPWLKGRRIVILEPRRLATRSAAGFMAGLLGEKPGGTIGYLMRQETKVSAKTRIEIMTEGILTRKLQADPALEDVGIVIFDEFHERSIHADLGLALCLQAQELLRPDLRIMVMSATMETDKIAKLLGTQVLEGSGQSYAVETVYLERELTGDWLEVLTGTIVKALNEQSGDILAFLPGAPEIRRAANVLRNSTPQNVVIAPLYSALSASQQEFALLPAAANQRKVVLATSIAETSLTVEGVRVVIDGGLMRVPSFSPRTGLTRLETVRVTKASADQRRGRAGRLAPGVCYRLWTKREELRLKTQNTPEILAADLLSLVLELAAWGVQQPSELIWLDPPHEEAFKEAKGMLKQLGALDDTGHITPHGQKMAAMGIQPRLSHMMLSAMELRLGHLACDVAALLEERDFMPRGVSADIALRLEALWDFRVNQAAAPDFDITAMRRILFSSKKYQQQLGLTQDRYEIGSLGLVLSFAYPDRIAAGKGQGRFILRSGKGVYVSKHELMANEAYLVAPDLEDKGKEARIFLAAPISEVQLRGQFPGEIRTETVVWWDGEGQMVRALYRECLDEIILKEVPLAQIPDSKAQVALIEGIKAEGLQILPWQPKDRQLQQRICFLHSFDEAWPDVSDESLLRSLAEWLGPYVQGIKRKAELGHLSLSNILLNLLSWEQRQKLAEYAPTHITVPSGQRILVDYAEPKRPVLAVRLQEMFGLCETPRLAGGKIALTLHLLSPAQRPVQITQDLAGFWENAYFAVKKDLAGRYPKHYWPDDPLAAMPTHRAKPRRQ
ncbi:MAG: ATP-dependent helicase HrpB [Pelosinus sp.]|nr:ATP-dependent helicase HrpB [Pelosinus sp.]